MEAKWVCSPEGCPDAYQIRQTVFVEEQGFVDEFDQIDEVCLHLVLYEDGEPAACARIFFDDVEECWHAGRIAVLKAQRGRQLGAALISEIAQKVRELGGDRIILGAQCRACAFYQKQGYHSYGETYLDEGCPHIMMEYWLDKK